MSRKRCLGGCSPDYKRRPGGDKKKNTIVVYTEGEKTEVEYLRYVREALQIPKELIRIESPEHSDPKGLVDDAVQAMQENKKKSRRGDEELVDQWWVLADTEGDRPGLPDAMQEARDNKVWLALSDASFEFWLLLHFQYTTAQNDVRGLIHCLQKHLPGYTGKNKCPDMEKLFKLLPHAIKNAWRLREDYTSKFFLQPRTDCDLLINAIARQSDNAEHFNIQIREHSPEFGDLSMHYFL